VMMGVSSFVSFQQPDPIPFYARSTDELYCQEGRQEVPCAPHEPIIEKARKPSEPFFRTRRERSFVYVR
jgi:hypothetical protein